MDPKKQPMWMGQPVLNEDHAHGLEQEAAINEFGRHMSRHDAEKAAYDNYKRNIHSQTAAYHLRGMKIAQAAGDQESAMQHSAAYVAHLKAAGHDPYGPVPADVSQHVSELTGKPYRFKSHAADVWVANHDPKRVK